MHLLKSSRVGFYVANKNCHIKYLSVQTRRHIKCDSFFSGIYRTQSLKSLNFSHPAWPDAFKKQIFVDHLHGQIKIAIYSCHIKTACVDGAKRSDCCFTYNLTLKSFISLNFSCNITYVIFDCFCRIYLAVVLSRNALALSLNVLLLFGEPVVHELRETVSFTYC